MALKKKVRMNNGLVLDYHRVALITIEPNQQVTILRHSYVDAEARQIEKDYAAGLIKPEEVMFPYVEHEYMHLDYDENMNMKNAYAWLKEQPGFEEAEDI